jgi:FixJ family two-component response regulator
MLSIITYVLDNDYEELLLLKPYLERACGADFEMYTDIEKFTDAIQLGVHIGIIDHHLNAPINGIEVGKKVLQNNPLTFLILYSGSGDKKVWQQATNAGFRGLVDKNDRDAFEQIEAMITRQKPALERSIKEHAALKNLNEKYQKYLS